MIEPSIDANDLADTRLACVHSISYLRKYVEGQCAPHYPVPAIPLAVLHGPDRVIIAEYSYEWDEFYPVYELLN